MHEAEVGYIGNWEGRSIGKAGVSTIASCRLCVTQAAYLVRHSGADVKSRECGRVQATIAM